MTQKGYNDTDRRAKNAVSNAAIQTRELNILHGTFRAVMKLGKSHGGSCAGFFWYHDDKSEIDIEAVTRGDSLVNNTINYTNHPSLDANGAPIPNATLSVPLSNSQHSILTTFQEYRFDNDISGVTFYVDDELVKTDVRGTVQDGGNLQLKLWADGNKWWSSTPSTQDVHLYVKSVVAYYNTSSSQSYIWARECNLAGGPNEITVCDGQIELKRSGDASSTPASNSGNRLSVFGFLKRKS